MRDHIFPRSILRIALLALLLIGVSTTAESTELLPECDFGWTVVDTLWVTSEIGELWNASEDGSEAEWVVIVIRHSGGDTALLIDPFSVRFTGNCNGIDTTKTSRIFDHIASESIRLAVADSLIGTSTDPSTPAKTRVYIPTCVTPLGAGSATTYSTISECNQAVRHFRYSTPPGTFNRVVTAVTGDLSCTSGEETVETDKWIE